MGEVLRAVVLGLVQGLTEFIPVSSTGHLVLVPSLLGWAEPSLAFGVAMHLGTLASVVLYFWAELLAIVRGLLGLDRSADGLLYRRLGLYLVVASVPVAVVGLLLEETVAALFSNPVVVSLLLLGTAALLVGGERVRNRRALGDGRPLVPAGERSRVDAPTSAGVPVRPGRLPAGDDPLDPVGMTLRELDLGQALRVGAAQCLALLPGISRSGTTITAGLASGLTREAATRFSFLLSLPALAGAGLLSLDDLSQPSDYSGTAIVAGVVAAFVSGYLAIRYLVALVAHRSLIGFAWYCVAAAAVGLVGSLVLSA